MKTSGNKLMGSLIIVLGAIFLLNNFFGDSDFWDFIINLWPIVLIILGIYIIKNQDRFMRSGSCGGKESGSRLFGDMEIGFDGREAGDSRYSTLIGDLRLDLTDAIFKPGEQSLDITFLIGDVQIYLPEHISVKLSARSLIGDIRFHGIKKDGLFQKLEHADDNYDSSEMKLRISAGGLIGDLTINKVK